jgi:hypothetical protein
VRRSMPTTSGRRRHERERSFLPRVFPDSAQNGDADERTEPPRASQRGVETGGGKWLHHSVSRHCASLLDPVSNRLGHEWAMREARAPLPHVPCSAMNDPHLRFVLPGTTTTGGTAIVPTHVPLVGEPLPDGLHSHAQIEYVELRPPTPTAHPVASPIAGPLDVSLLIAALAVAGMIAAGSFTLRLWRPGIALTRSAR